MSRALRDRSFAINYEGVYECIFVTHFFDGKTSKYKALVLYLAEASNLGGESYFFGGIDIFLKHMTKN